MILRDSIDPNLIPLDSDAVAGYGDGIYLWTTAGWDRFPAATPRLVIVVRPGDRGDVADAERYDFGPADVVGFVLAFDRPGRRAPTVYCNRSAWPQIVAALVAAGLDPTAIDWWIATLDGTTFLWYGSLGVVPPAGLRVVAIQVRDAGPYDESVILDPSWVGGAIVAQLDDIQATVEVVNTRTAELYNLLTFGDTGPEDATGEHKPLIVVAPLAALRAELDALKAELEAGGQIDAAAAIARIEAALRSA